MLYPKQSSACTPRRYFALLGAWLVVALTSSLSGGLIPVSIAQESVSTQQQVEILIADMSRVAHEVSANTEAVKELEEKIEEQEVAVANAEEVASQAALTAEITTKNLQAQQEDIDELALSRYRGVNLSVISTTLGSTDPAEAAERLGYIGTLSRRARKNLTTVAANARQARNARKEAESAVERARAERDSLTREKLELTKEKELLAVRQEEIEARVNALTPEQRVAWINQFQPAAELDPALLDSFAFSGSGGQAVKAALSKQGAPYGWGSTGPYQFDCSGLMYWAYQQQGKTIPRTSQAQMAGGTPVSFDQLQPGDLVGYYGNHSHVGMYVGNGQVVHASTYGVPVQVVPMFSMPAVTAVRY